MNSTELRERLLLSGLADETTIIGCSESELRQIDSVVGRTLPMTYRDFMSHFGQQAGRFLRDVDCFFPAVLSLRSTATEILGDAAEYNLHLPSNAFVFGVRNREQFMFFEDLSDDPPIMFYMSGESSPSKIAASFWDYISDELNQAESSYKQIRGTPYDFS